MIPLTEGELLAMREVQAKATPGPWWRGWTTWYRGHDGSQGKYVWTGAEGEFARDPATPHIEFFGRDVEENADYVASARTDWPRVVEWALEARRFLQTQFRYHDSACSSLAKTVTVPCDCGYDEARRLLGE